MVGRFSREGDGNTNANVAAGRVRVAVGLVRPPLRAVPGQPGVRRRREGAEWEVGAEEVEGAVDDERMEVTAGSSGRTERG